MTAFKPFKSNLFPDVDIVTGAPSPDHIIIDPFKLVEEQIDFDQDAFTVITNIFKKYCGGGNASTEAELFKWLQRVLIDYLKSDATIDRSMMFYRDCKVIYIEDQGKLHVEKNNDTCPTLPNGEILQSEIRLGRVFLRQFGVDTMHVKAGRVFYDEDDMDLFVTSVKNDIETWCDVVHFVTTI